MITWKSDVYMAQDGTRIELPARTEYSISELEDLERQEYENRHRPIVGILFGVLFSAPFWLFGAYIYILRYYR